MKNQSVEKNVPATSLKVLGIALAAAIFVGAVVFAGVSVVIASVEAANDQYIDTSGVMMSSGPRPQPVATAKVVKAMDIRNLQSRPSGTLKTVVLNGFGENAGKGIQHVMKVSSITQIGQTERYIYFKPNPIAKYLRITKKGVQIISDAPAALGSDGRRLQRGYDGTSVPYEIDEALYGLTDPETYAFDLALGRMKAELLEIHEAWKNANSTDEKESLAYITDDLLEVVAPDALDKIHVFEDEVEQAIQQARDEAAAYEAELQAIADEAEAELKRIEDEAIAKVNAFNEEKNYYYTPLEEAQREWLCSKYPERC